MSLQKLLASVQTNQLPEFDEPVFFQRESIPKDDPLQCAIALHCENQLERSCQYLIRSSLSRHPVAVYLLAIALRHGWGCKKDEELAAALLECSIQLVLGAMPKNATYEVAVTSPTGQTDHAQAPAPTPIDRLVNDSGHGALPNPSTLGRAEHVLTTDQLHEEPSGLAVITERPSSRQSGSPHSSMSRSQTISISPIRSRSAGGPIAVLNGNGSSQNGTIPRSLNARGSIITLDSFSGVIGGDGPAGDSHLDYETVRSFLPLPLFELGMCYHQGWGVPVSQLTAVYYYQLAAQLGDPDAQAELAESYLSGIGVRKNKKMAAKWFRKAAERGLSFVNNSWIWEDKYNDSQDRISAPASALASASASVHSRRSSKRRSDDGR
ncbi:uncharacterized protein BJ171DRAFT_567067 [Polychytrium aggregatum]|uniref:uncharacterized protein n=1 Tax=Polychytrium aggregatum TaxID=110093 RepID=UPI0022FE94E6|nr:uncharacterized protein BJ171DRAFT_567067 [Polychytrium aggregatum]KAI9205727.1 hypothetical protein BJ171DRAFT_567067 [Polychytrium aggregatum]